MNTGVHGFCDFNIPSQCSNTTTLREVVSRAIKRKNLCFYHTSHFSSRFMLFNSLSVGYATIAINTTIEEDFLVHTKKKKGNKKNEQAEEKKDIPLPPKLNFSEEDLNSVKVMIVYTLFDETFIYLLIILK